MYPVTICARFFFQLQPFRAIPWQLVNNVDRGHEPILAGYSSHRTVNTRRLIHASPCIEKVKYPHGKHYMCNNPCTSNTSHMHKKPRLISSSTYSHTNPLQTHRNLPTIASLVSKKSPACQPASNTKAKPKLCHSPRPNHGAAPHTLFHQHTTTKQVPNLTCGLLNK